MKSVINYFIQNSKITHLILGVVLLCGCYSFYALPKQLQPEMKLNYISISTFYPNQSPETVEKFITLKIEDAIKGLRRYKMMNSTSAQSSSNITLEVKKGVDLRAYKEDLEALIDNISDFPSDLELKPSVSIFKNQSTPFVLAIQGQDDNYARLRAVAKQVEGRLETVAGIESISIQNLRDKRLIIELDYLKMQDLNISVNTVVQKLRDYNMLVSLGKSQELQGQKKLTIFQEIQSVADAKQVIIQTNFESQAIYLADIASIKRGFEEESVHQLVNGKPGLMINVVRAEGVDVFELEKALKEQVFSINEDLEATELRILINPVDFLSPMYQAVVLGIIIAVIAVVLTLGFILNFTTAAWTALGIPFSILFCFILYPILDLKFHFITLFTFIIITGMLVDDAIIVAENIFRMKEKGMAPQEAALEGSYQMLGPILAIVATTILGFLPIVFLPDPFGSFLGDMPIIVALCLIGSLFECFLILPSHLQKKLKPRKENRVQKLLVLLNKTYQFAIEKTLKFKRVSLSLCIVLFTIFTIAYFGLGSFEFISEQAPEYFEINYALKPGTSLDQSKASTQALAELTLEYKESGKIKQYVGVSGANLSLSGGGSSFQSHLGTLYGFFPNIKDAKFDLFATADQFKADIMGFKDRFEALEYKNIAGGPPTTKAVQYDFLSHDKQLLIHFSKKVKDFLNTIETLEQVESSYKAEAVGLDIKIDYQKAEQLAVNTREIASLLRTAFTGVEIAGFREGNEKVDYWVSLPVEIRNSWENIYELSVKNKTGFMVKLKDLIQVKESSVEEKILHKNAVPVITVSADIQKGIRNPKPIYQKIDAFIAKEVKLFPNIRVEKEGASKRDAESLQQLLFGFGISVFGIYVILCVLFNSFLQPFLMMVVIPLIFMGVAGLKTFHGLPVGFSTLIGCLGAMGVVINDSVVMTHALNRMIQKGTLALNDFVAVTSTRFRPILLTTLTTTLTLLPVAYPIFGLKVDAYLVDLAFSLMWGIIVGTLVTLFVIPLLFKFFVKQWSATVSVAGKSAVDKT